MKYIVEGEWIRPVKRGYKFICCDCGLVHILDFDHQPYGNGREVIFRMFSDNRSTAAIRREMKKRSQNEKAYVPS